MNPPGHWFESNPLWFKTAVFYEILSLIHI